MSADYPELTAQAARARPEITPPDSTVRLSERRLGEGLDELAGLLGVLHERLAPVLRADEQESVSPHLAELARTSPLGEELDTLAQRVENMSRSVRGTLERLDV